MTTVALLAVARAAGLVARSPGFSHPSVPMPVRAGLAVALGLAIAPQVADPGALALPELSIAVAANVLVGAAIGFGASLLYDAAYFAGRTIDDYLGVRGSMPNASVTSAQAFGRLWSSVFLAAFVLLDGWVPVVHAFAASFAAIGPRAMPSVAGWAGYTHALAHGVLLAAALVAAPAIAVAASLQLGLAAVTRIIPRLASFTLAFPLVFGAALCVTVVTVPLLVPAGARPWLVLPWEGR